MDVFAHRVESPADSAARRRTRSSRSGCANVRPVSYNPSTTGVVYGIAPHCSKEKTVMSLPFRTVVAAATVTALAGGLFTAATAAPASAAPARYADDFNGDGHRDIAIGAPYKSINGVSAAGGVVVSLGSATGLTTQKIGLNQSSAGVPGTPEEGDRFGMSIASGDLDSDGYADLVVGADGEDVGAYEGQGSVTSSGAAPSRSPAAPRPRWTTHTSGRVMAWTWRWGTSPVTAARTSP
ncbi:FG-GAP-like repeat-containing protein [Streptomyces sp900116325]|uniref:FG-GAP and VCBS repeat-containing protein n=1 Tax=Streptomyces sp. 900116325 TaxID=3154295 RepID=UPI0033B1F943